jgi:L-threonylcarbamoyladenylate synthase
MRLMERFWPGPLTLVLPVRRGAVAPQVTAGLDTVAVRVPDHPLARRLIAKAGCPIAAPSANRSGRPSPTVAAHVLEDLYGRIDGVLDGGPTGVGVESTVVRVLDGVIYILRPGGVTAEMLQECAGDDAVVVEAAEGTAASGGNAGVGAAAGARAGAGAERASAAPGGPAFAAGAFDSATPRSPGVKYTHYAPRGEMLLVTGDPARVREAVQAAARRKREEGRRVGILACREHAAAYEADAVIVLGPREAPEEAARNLYAALRECDAQELEAIVAEGFPETGIGSALMNRLRKAAGGNVLAV